jgi:hypothetical protein
MLSVFGFSLSVICSGRPIEMDMDKPHILAKPLKPVFAI